MSVDLEQYAFRSTLRSSMAGASFLLALACGSKASLPDASAGTGGVASAGGGAIGGALQSGDSNGGSSGDDTVTAQCSSGDTRVCVGPAACKGGQSCGDDERWSECDCGNGGAAAGGSAAGGSAVGGSNNGGAGGSSGDASSAEGGSAGDAGNSGSGWVDDPCPVGPIGTDCSGQCATRPAICDGDCPVHVALSLSGPGVFARLPSPSPPASNSKLAAYAMGFEYTPVPNQHAFFLVCVPEPWHINEGVISCSTNSQRRCIQLNVGHKYFSVWTSDPNAPAINLTAEIDENPL